jgi:hypothetical protein
MSDRNKADRNAKKFGYLFMQLKFAPKAFQVHTIILEKLLCIFNDKSSRFAPHLGLLKATSRANPAELPEANLFLV